jgi:hypothetical protein
VEGIDDARFAGCNSIRAGRDQHNENSRGSKLRDLLLDDRELIPDMFAGAESSVAGCDAAF